MIDETLETIGNNRIEGKPNKRNLLILAAIAFVAVVIFNLTVWLPVSQALDRDERNTGFAVHAYRAWLLHPAEITIDLVSLEQAAPLDLNRALFQSAAALRNRSFSKVILARKGKPVFVMDGADFQELGQEFEAGQNPIFLIRTLPEKLKTPDGQEAFGSWSGGLLGVLTRQMEDSNAFARSWAAGEPTQA